MAAGRRVAELGPASVVALGLRDGMTLTPELGGAIKSREAFERAYKTAVAALARRPLSAQAVRERLTKRGFETPAIDAAIASLTAEGLIDDGALARRLVREETARGGAGTPFLESKLAARGVDPGTAARALEAELELHAHSAHRAAEQRARSLPSTLPPEAKARRLYAFLARRGFDEHDATEAVRRVLGIAPDAGD